ncbi:MAG: extracellular solute-binding protein [Anaerolineae bacterium]|nr:extracellular solute-binding protein [Anaerolineae bacterium]
MYQRLLTVLLVTALLAGAVPRAGAQDAGDNILTLAVPEFLESFFTPEMFEAFQAETGYKVEVVKGGFPYFEPAATAGLDKHLEAVGEYAALADVLFAGANTLSPEATRAGYFLDLAPLANSDPQLDLEDFYPAAWQSFQWDQGIWALPAAIDVITLNYNPEAFDAAGLAYPDAQWTMAELAHAARTLTQYDEQGEVKTPGLQALGTNTLVLLRALLGRGFYDASTFPETPRFDDPALEALLSEGLALQDEGAIAASGGVQIIGGGSPIPMRVESSMGLSSEFGGSAATSRGALLPGGVAGLDVQGFAVSAGTRRPEAAYALARFLTTDPRVTNSLFGMWPARQSLAGAAPEASEGAVMIVPNEFAPEVEAFIDEAIRNALPASEMRYGTYLNLALQKMREDQLDARTALRETEIEAVSIAQAALDRRGATVVDVAQPAPTPALAAGEIALDFGLTSFYSPLPNQAEWDRAIAEFVAADPEVGAIEFNTSFVRDANALAETMDCFVLPYNAVPTIDPANFLNLDPFLDADPSFDRDDLIGNILAAVQRDNKTWALPLSLQPGALRYHADRFAQSGLPQPIGGWTVEQFVDALHALKPTPADPAPFAPRFGGDYLFMLITAFGGLPVDYRTDPPTFDFTDPATVDAIRQVLDLARDGYIKYERLVSEDAGASMMVAVDGEDDTAIYPDSLGTFVFVSSDGSEAYNDPYRMVAYPRGSRFIPMSYNLQTAYISANAENPAACYRWLSFLAQRPEFFLDMPARRSVLDDPALAALRNADVAALYREYAGFLQDPNLVEFPTLIGTATTATESYIIQNWLFRAFDAYVLDGADLETVLAEAETLAHGYRACAAGIAPYDPAAYESEGEYMQQFVDCAVRIDPSLKAQFGQ